MVIFMAYTVWLVDLLDELMNINDDVDNGGADKASQDKCVTKQIFV
jgi:hypothetical protein